MIKPVVQYAGEVEFFNYNDNPEWPVAYVYDVIDHHKLGNCPFLRTSVIVQRNNNGSFETLNTIYEPC